MAQSKCPHFNKIISSNSHLNRHINSVHSAGPRVRVPCQLCPKTFGDKDVLKHHVKTNHFRERPNPCNFCPKKFVTKRDLSQHLNSAHFGIAYPCDICGISVTSVASLKLHINNIHHRLKPHKCPHCLKSFGLKSSLINHINILHKPQNQEYKCNTCSKVYLKKGSLYAHQIRHGEKKYKCSICSKAFYTKHQQQSHLETHFKSEKTVKCTLCDKRFETQSVETQSGRRQHFRTIHEFIGKVTCLFCGKVCASNSVLHDHILGHIQETWYECELCDKTFCSNGQKTSHMLSHTGEKSFECTSCGKRFPSGSNLRQHEITHMAQKPNQCIFCGKRFDGSCALRDHILM